MKKLRSKAAWRCKCPRVKTWYEKKHGIKYPGKHWFVDAWRRQEYGRGRTNPRQQGHSSPSCPLRPRIAGEELWEGKNVGLTVEDMDFLCRADPW